LNHLYPLAPWCRIDTNAAKLYGAIMAQARLPVFYQGFGVPDTLEVRFLMLSLHLFAVLHRLKEEVPAAVGLAQELSDRFSADMDTVLREIGIGDLSIPKKVRGLAASSAALLQAFEEALAAGDRGRCRRHRQNVAARNRTIRGCKRAPRALSNKGGAPGLRRKASRRSAPAR
jgi:hypothetical protein